MYHEDFVERAIQTCLEAAVIVLLACQLAAPHKEA
jgi:hypothetical protein